MTYIDNVLLASPLEVMREFENISEEIALLQRKKALTEQLIELMFQQGEAAAAELNAYRTQLAVGPLRYQIRQVFLESAEDDLWLPMNVHEQLQERGNTSVTLDNVRVTMTRMAGKGELERLPADESNLFFYRLPAEDAN